MQSTLAIYAAEYNLRNAARVLRTSLAGRALISLYRWLHPHPFA